MRTVTVFWASIPILLAVWPQHAQTAELSSLRQHATWAQLAVLELSSEDPDAAIAAVTAAGGKVRLLAGNIAWVDLPPEAESGLKQAPEVFRIHRQAWSAPYSSLFAEGASRFLQQLSDGSAFAPPPPNSGPPCSGALLVEESETGDKRKACTLDYQQWPPTSDPFLGRTHIMQGRIVANYFLVESDASGPENAFNWDSTEISMASTEIQESLAWWAWVVGIFGYNATFVLQLHLPSQPECQVMGEPTLHDSAWVQTVMVPEVMGSMGFGATGGSCDTGRFNESTIGSNDRAFSAFILEGNNYLSDGVYFAWAYLNGPYIMSLRRPGQYGANYMNVVLQHEMGHTFRACDEYSQPGYGGCQNCDPCIPGATRNYNCVLGCGSNAECIMRSSLSESGDCCGWTRVMVGLSAGYAVPSLLAPSGNPALSNGVVALTLGHVWGVPRYRFDLGFQSSGAGLFFTTSKSNIATTFELPEGQYYWRARSEDGALNYSAFSAVSSFRVDHAPVTPPANARILAASVDSSAPTWVRLFDSAGTGNLTSFLAFNGIRYGSTIAAVDVDGNGVDEIFVAPRNLSGDRGTVRIFERDGDFLAELDSLCAFQIDQLEIAGGDLDGDGSDEFVIAPMRGGPQSEYVLRIFEADGTFLDEFVPFPNGRSACRVACADVDGDGIEEILTSEGENSDIRTVRVLRLDGSLVTEIDPTTGTGHSGFAVAGADVDGDGAAEIVVSAARDEPNANEVRVLRLDGSLVTQFNGSLDNGHRVTLAGGDLDGDGVEEILTGTADGYSSTAEVRIWDGAGNLQGQFLAFAPLEGGVNLAVLQNTPDPTDVALPGDDTSSDTVVWESIHPNPMSESGAELRFRAPVGTRPGVRIFDVRGRAVRELSVVAYQGGRFGAQWDGFDRRGERVASGVYFAQLRAGKAILTKRFTVAD